MHKIEGIVNIPFVISAIKNEEIWWDISRKTKSKQIRLDIHWFLKNHGKYSISKVAKSLRHSSNPDKNNQISWDIQQILEIEQQEASEGLRGEEAKRRRG